jgi:hypothetical protein
MIALITGMVGIASTILAWFLNPRRKLYAELDSIYKTLEVCYEKRDKALQNGDNDTLTIVFADIVKLCQRKAVLLQRLR